MVRNDYESSLAHLNTGAPRGKFRGKDLKTLTKHGEREFSGKNLNVYNGPLLARLKEEFPDSKVHLQPAT